MSPSLLWPAPLAASPLAVSDSSAEALARLALEITACEACPRLRGHCQAIAQAKRKAYREEAYWAKPVAGFGDPQARLIVVGLAPGAHGANRTGRVFTGDRSGDWLYRALYRAGFANQAESRRQNDGLTLRDAWVSCVVRCAPPDNRPSREEILRCSGHLSQELRLLKNAQVFIALGAVALEGLWPILTSASPAKGSPRPKFRHGEILSLSHPDKAGGMPFSGVRSRTLLLSYHPSQQNTFTGKLTEAMFDSIFSEAKKILGSTPKS